MDLGSSPGPDDNMSPGGKQAFYISLFVRSFTSSDPPLSTGEEPLSVSFPPSYTLHTFIYYNKVPDGPVTSQLPMASSLPLWGVLFLIYFCLITLFYNNL